jgi:hypothetical protein
VRLMKTRRRTKTSDGQRAEAGTRKKKPGAWRGSRDPLLRDRSHSKVTQIETNRIIFSLSSGNVGK